jgi:hypothetical protein
MAPAVTTTTTRSPPTPGNAFKDRANQEVTVDPTNPNVIYAASEVPFAALLRC